MRIKYSQVSGPHAGPGPSERHTLSAAAWFLLGAAVTLTLSWALAKPENLSLQSVKQSFDDAAAMVVSRVQKDVPAKGLPTLYLDIGLRAYQGMAAQRDEALSMGVLIKDDSDWWSADIRYEDQTIPVDIRLKGDWIDHLGENKWSFRIRTHDDAVIMGMHAFTLQSPATRGYLTEWVFLSELTHSGILAPGYSFVNVMVNGDSWGIYALEQFFSPELLESQGRQLGVIVKFDESRMWERRSWSTEDQWRATWDPGMTYGVNTYAEVDDFYTSTVEQDAVLREQSVTALGLLRGFQANKLTPGQVFDTELLGRFLAQSTLWGAGHGLLWHNARYYYNSVTSRLEPAGFDSGAFLSEGYAVDLAQYNDLDVMRAFAQEAIRISQPAYLEDLRARYGAQFDEYQAILSGEFSAADLQPPWDALAARQAMLAAVFINKAQQVYAYQVYTDTASAVDIEVGNILQYPVELLQLQSEGGVVDIDSSWVGEADEYLLHQDAFPAVILQRAYDAAPRYITLHLPIEAVQKLFPSGHQGKSETLRLVSRLVGVEDTVTLDVRRDYPPILAAPVLPVEPTMEEALAQYPFLTEAEEPGYLRVKPGTWDVQGDLILPRGVGLRADQQVTLRFGQGALLLAQGPLQLVGPDENWIVLEPQSDSWAGVVVLQAGSEDESTLQNVEIVGTSGVHREGWMTAGGVTFYESPVSVSSCRFADSTAEDALSIMRSAYSITGTEFRSNATDGLGGDFAQGTITNCLFADIHGDAIDLRGGQTDIQDSELENVGNIGISVGEGGQVHAERIYVRDAAIAVASKDQSQVTIQDIGIYRAMIAGMVAFVQKAEYGTASIVASGVDIRDHSTPALVQRGSQVVIDGGAAATGALNVNDLGRRLEALAGRQAVSYALGSEMQLGAYSLAATSLHPGDDLRLVLYWECTKKPDRAYTVFVHVLDAEAKIVKQDDCMPRTNGYPTTQWPAMQLVDDEHILPLPADMPPGEYTIAVGLYYYDPATGQADRLPVVDGSGQDVPDGRILLETPLEVSP